MKKITPMMQQYQEIKGKYKDCFLFFRLGDFYELFFEDAVLASKELEITLTGRDCGQSEKAPMCGVPYHSAEGYIAKLVEKGYKVAICEQVENPKTAKTIVKREVVRIVTPGTVLDSTMLEEGKNNYIMCIYEDTKGYGFAVADITIGEFLVSTFSKEDFKKILDEIAKFCPKEIIVNINLKNTDMIENIFHIKPAIYSTGNFDYTNAHSKLCTHFKVANLLDFELKNASHSICAGGALLEYLYETQKNSLAHISTIQPYFKEKYMMLNISSRKNLELTETIRDKIKKGSLLWVLDRTKTSMGARLLRKWIEQPILDIEQINKRFDAVEDYLEDVMLREELKEYLNTVYDLERLITKTIYGNANSRDLISLKKSLLNLPYIKDILGKYKSKLNIEMYKNFDELNDIYSDIESAIIDDPPFSIREGGFVKDGYNPELDRLREIKNKGTDWLVEIESRERKQTGIKNLKIRFNKIFGYYIEVTNSYKGLVPDSYIRRQTLANCERFTTAELKKIEDDILGADEKLVELEYNLFMGLCSCIATHVERIQHTAYILSTIDVLQSLADVAEKNEYTRPIVDDSGIIDIKEGRHPVVEQMLCGSFVSNDVFLDKENNRLSIITGPNMAGKSTFMRQTALIVLMAQIGSFVPAKSARIGIIKQIFTRVGASDDLATGQSTFMVEMSEVANILNNASKDSLLILDEIGRGTSTFDGLSIAWSVLEYIAIKIGAKTLFATHYHELTELEGKVEGAKNYRITVKEEGEDIAFLRKIERGGADNSYGIHVAKIAGLPQAILERSTEILIALNNADITKVNKPSKGDLYYKRPSAKDKSRHRIILKELMDIDVDSLTPREALENLYKLQTKAKGLEGDEN